MKKETGYQDLYQILALCCVAVVVVVVRVCRWSVLLVTYCRVSKIPARGNPETLKRRTDNEADATRYAHIAHRASVDALQRFENKSMAKVSKSAHRTPQQTISSHITTY